ncbi:MAG: hypothetical protein ACLUIQ_03420 [Dialister invisus]
MGRRNTGRYKRKGESFLSEGGEWNTLNAGQGSRVTRFAGDAKAVQFIKRCGTACN